MSPRKCIIKAIISRNINHEREQDLSPPIALTKRNDDGHQNLCQNRESLSEIFGSNNISIFNVVSKRVEGTSRKNQSRSGGKSTQEKWRNQRIVENP